MNQPLPRQATQPGFFTKLLTLLASVILLIVGLTFSVLFLAVVVAVGLVVWGYFWWKTRALRQAMRERPPGGHVVEGEAVVVESDNATG
jgi:ABC-type bacteriocin/lantibiotic exporter with double-glycine peptidase domain